MLVKRIRGHHCANRRPNQVHYSDVIMGAIASQITSLTIVYSTVYSDADERKHQSSASLAFVRGIHRGSVNSPHKWPVKRKLLPFDDAIMLLSLSRCQWFCMITIGQMTSFKWPTKFRNIAGVEIIYQTHLHWFYQVLNVSLFFSINVLLESKCYWRSAQIWLEELANSSAY